MNAKKFLSMILAAAAMFSLCLPAFATSDLEDQVLAEVTGLYADYYDISDASASVVNSTENEDGSVTYLVDASFKRTLKETSADEMPYIQGLKEAAAELTDPAEIAAAENRIAIWTAELEGNYIGVAQDTNVTLSVTIPQGISTRTAYFAEPFDIQVYDSFMNEEFPLESIQPKGDDELKEAALATIEQVAEEADMQQISYAANLLPIQYYDRIAARDYARNWSCNSGSMNDHSSCHNSKYKFYTGNDCANFVSQCICEGGLKTDDYWKPYSYEWISVGSLTAHMEGNYCYASDNDYDAFAGSIINLLNSNGTNAGHVGLVDQNDTRTMTLCSHTACRKSVPFSWFSNRNFYVPRWDSYTNSWTTLH